MVDESRWFTDEAGEEKIILDRVIERETHPYRKQILQRLRRRIDGLHGDAPDEEPTR